MHPVKWNVDLILIISISLIIEEMYIIFFPLSSSQMINMHGLVESIFNSC